MAIASDFEITEYLHRIGIRKRPSTDSGGLSDLHLHHLQHVPFENLDIHFKKRFTLNRSDVWQKVVAEHRGGFCYELNSIFNELLIALGFSTHLISCRVTTDQGVAGPEFDHMAIIVSTDTELLADVGFGDLFLTPLRINTIDRQYDGRNYFTIAPLKDDGYLLSMSPDGEQFLPKYVFTKKPRSVADFISTCTNKQIDPDSHFVRNTICTRVTEDGRVTVYNNKFTQRKGDERLEVLIVDDEALKEILTNHFSIVI